MDSFLYVTVGAALGGALRYLCILFLPMPILVVNIVGSFLIGLSTNKLGLNQAQLLFINTGILGGFTTMSSFNLELLSELNKGNLTGMILYASCSIILSFLACYLGYRIS